MEIYETFKEGTCCSCGAGEKEFGPICLIAWEI
jgi:hypothetical protein